MTGRIVIALCLSLTGCKSEPSQTEKAHSQQQDRASGLAKTGAQKWQALVDAAVAAPELAKVEELKAAYLAEAAKVRADVQAMPASDRGKVHSELSAFQDSAEYKAKVKQIEERAVALGEGGRDTATALRELTNFRFVYAIHSEK